MNTASSIAAAVIGGIAGAIAGLIGNGFFSGLLSGAVVGGVVGFLFSLAPRSFDDPIIAVESFSPAGFVGGIAGSVAANTGLIGGFVSCGAGWTLGLFLPAMFIALATPRERLGVDISQGTAGPKSPSVPYPDIDKARAAPAPNKQDCAPLFPDVPWAENPHYLELFQRYRDYDIGLSSAYVQCRSTPVENLIKQSDYEIDGGEFIDVMTLVTSLEVVAHKTGSEVPKPVMIKPYVFQTASSVEDYFGDDLVDLAKRLVWSVIYKHDRLFIDDNDTDENGDYFIDLLYRIALYSVATNGEDAEKLKAELSPQSEAVTPSLSPTEQERNKEFAESIADEKIVILTARQWEDGPWWARAYKAREAALAYLKVVPQRGCYATEGLFIRDIEANSEAVADALYDAGVEPLDSESGQDKPVVINRLMARGWRS